MDGDEDIFADIDPDGYMVGKFPIRVRCFKTATIDLLHDLPQGSVITEISNDAESHITVTPCNSEACFVRDVTYSAPLSQMVALIDISKQCQQKFVVSISCFDNEKYVRCNKCNQFSF